MKSETGQQLMRKIPENRQMTKDQRRKLINLICGHLLDRSIVPGQNLISKYSKDIVIMFPLEIASSFYDETTKSGPFLSRANYLIRMYRGDGRLDKAPKRLKQEASVDTQELTFTVQEIRADEFVKNNSEIDYQSLYPHWTESARYRLSQIKGLPTIQPSKIFELYLAYTRPDASMLVNIKL
jgi:hypothetical protein